MKLRCSECMVVILNYLINNFYILISLNIFVSKYGVVKFLILEDIVIIKKVFE